jgi:hypothetical protein
VIEQILRHANVITTMNIYVKTVSADDECDEDWGGLYCCIFRNSLRFFHFTRNTRVFCRLLPSLSSRIRLSNAFPSLLWTPKVPKKVT